MSLLDPDFASSSMAARIRDYRDLVCWQQALELALEVNALADALPKREWDSASQLRRAARSVHLNIAEGNGRRTSAEYLRFLGDARASLNEVDSELRFPSPFPPLHFPRSLFPFSPVPAF